MEKDTFLKISIKFCFVKRLDFAGNVAISIFKYIQYRRCRIKNCTTGCNVFSKITNALTIVNKNSGRITVVIKVCIHTAYNIVSKIILVILGHFGKFLMRPVRLVIKIFIDLIISGDNRHIRVGRINLDNMKDLSASSGCIIDNHFRFNSSSRNKHVIFF